MADFNHFAQISEELHLALSQTVRKAAFDIAAEYQATCPKDTSFMANSAYVVTRNESTYGQGGSPTHKDSYLLPEVERPEDDLTAYAAIGANYAVYVELGTRHMAPQPAFYPAVETVRPQFVDALSKIESKLR